MSQRFKEIVIRRRTMTIIYIAVLVIFFYYALFFTDASKILGGWSDDLTIDFNNGWTDEEGNDIDPTSFSKNKEAVVRLYNNLPEGLDLDEDLHFNSHNVFFNVYIDGKTVYTFEKQENSTGLGYGDRFHSIDLGSAWNGEGRICIEAMPIYRGDKSACFSEMMISSWQSYLHKEFYRHGFDFILSLLICFFGTTIIVFHFSSSIRKSREADLLALGIVVICMGLWTAGETLIPNLIMGTTEMVRAMDYGLLLLAPYPMVVFVNSITKQRKVGYVMTEFMVSAVATVIVLYARNVKQMDLHNLTVVIHSSILIAAGIIIVDLVQNYRYCKASGQSTDLKLLYIATAFMIGGGILDMIIYVFMDKRRVDGGFFLRIGLALFVVVMLYQIAIWAGHEKKQTEKDHFINDLLTYSMAGGSPERSINKMLEYMGRELHADRAFILEEMKDGSFAATYEWCKDGITPMGERMDSVPFKGGLDLWFKKFNSGQTVVIEDVEDYKEESTVIYNNFKIGGVHTVVADQLAIDSTHIGCFGLVNPPGERAKDVSDIIKLISFFLAVTLRQRNNHALLRQYSYRDQMTGVMNRRALEEFEEEKLDRSKPYGVLMADINGLKRANDRMGHDAGDHMIRDVASALAEVFGKDNVYRMGGDEFLAIGFSSSESGFIQNKRTLELLLNSKKRSASIGYVYMPEGGEDFEAVKKQADTLMYKDKQRYYEEVSNDRRTGSDRRSGTDRRLK